MSATLRQTNTQTGSASHTNLQKTSTYLKYFHHSINSAIPFPNSAQRQVAALLLRLKGYPRRKNEKAQPCESGYVIDFLVGWARLELATNGLKVRCSNQLSYQPQARYYDFLLFYCQTQRAPLGKMPVAQHTRPLYHSHMPSCSKPHFS